MKSRWGTLTDDDLKSIAGKKDQLVGKVQERYGIMKESAGKQVDPWLAKVGDGPTRAEKNLQKSNSSP